jgi:hypothetical protein
MARLWNKLKIFSSTNAVRKSNKKKRSPLWKNRPLFIFIYYHFLQPLSFFTENCQDSSTKKGAAATPYQTIYS